LSSMCEFWGFHGGDFSSRGLLGSDAVYGCGRIQTFRRAVLISCLFNILNYSLSSPSQGRIF
jgi:hypothetical protein